MSESDRRDDLHVEPARGGWVELYDGRVRSTMSHAHRHDELEVNLVLQGWVDYLVGDRRVRFGRHSLGWLLPHQGHRLIHRAADVRMWIAVFSPELVAGMGHDDAGPPEQWQQDDGLVRVVDRHIGDLDRICRQLADPDVPDNRHRAGLSWLLSECWRAYRSSRGAPTGARLHPAVEAAARWLHDHADDAAADDLPALARRCGLSRPWLSRLFHEQLGESLTDYRNRQRLYRFRELLADPQDFSTTNAALAAGFGSYTQCFRVVREHTGLSPRALAREIRESLT